jgi:secondary thiamine-phosphate synthase enzyme
MKEISVPSTKRVEVIDITDQVQDLLPKDLEGFCVVFCPHCSASVLVGDTVEHLAEDYVQMGAQIYREYGPYKHFAHGDANAEGHIFGLLHGCTVLVPVETGKIKMGTNQKIIFFEASGPRPDRKIWVDWFRK